MRFSSGSGQRSQHSTGKLIPLFLELIQQGLYLFSLLCNFVWGQLSGAGVGEDQLELLQCRGSCILLYDAGNLLPFLRFVLSQQFDGRPAAVARDDGIAVIIRIFPDADWLLQSRKGDIVSQSLDIAELIEVVGVAVNQIQPDVLDLLPAGVRT